MSVSAALLLGLASSCLPRPAAGGPLVPPHNVRMITMNTRYTLSWDYDASVEEPVTFTSQYLSKYKLNLKKSATWTTACNETSQWSCDLTVFNLHYLGIYLVRVQASVNGMHSDWVQKEFCPDKDGKTWKNMFLDTLNTGIIRLWFTYREVLQLPSSVWKQNRSSVLTPVETQPIWRGRWSPARFLSIGKGCGVLVLFRPAAVGPPVGVRLVPVGSDLEVTIVDPRTTNNSSMRDLLPRLYYHIRYWEYLEETLGSVLSSSANMVTLPNLKAWTRYCVSVQSRCDFYQKSSNFTAPHCMQTKGAVPWWQIIMFFLGSLMICFLLVMVLLYSLFFICKTFKATWYPANRLPAHFQQFPHDSPGSDVPPLLTPDSESLLYDKVLICPEPRLWEQEVPPEKDLADRPSDSSCQVSSSSGDSGVYSTGGFSGLQQPLPASLRVSGAPEQVKMQEIKSEASFADDDVAIWI